jgi:Protein of unknown function (DUF3592)
LNPYIIILILFIVGGLGMTVWGWSIIARGKRTLRWPAVEGIIEKSQQSSDGDDLFPHIVFSYTVSGHSYERDLEFPGGTHPTPVLAASYVNKYPEGAKVLAYYNPAQPGQATLEPGPARDDWFIFILGIMVTVIGIGFLIFSG